MNTVNIAIYQTKNGRKPYIEWLNKLDENVRATVRSRINRVRLGNFGECRSIKGNISGIGELVLDFGPGYRIYYGKKSEVSIVILIGGIKKSQVRDIEKAKEYWIDYKGNEL